MSETTMSNSERLLGIIRELDNLMAQLVVDGQDGYATVLRPLAEELMWLWKDMTEFEE